jgi:hypothetical protein
MVPSAVSNAALSTVRGAILANGALPLLGKVKIWFRDIIDNGHCAVRATVRAI